MDKIIQEQILEDGELTSDSDNENFVKSGKNISSCESSDNKNGHTVIKNLLDFESQLNDFKKLTQIEENKNIGSPTNGNKKDSDEKQSILNYEDDQVIFMRGGSPQASSHPTSLYNPETYEINAGFLGGLSPMKNTKQQHFHKGKRTSKRKKSKSRLGEKSDNSKELILNDENSNSSKNSINSLPQLCKFYLLRTCAKSEFCNFLHSEFPCKYYYLGLQCPDGNNCKLSHGEALSDEMKEALLLHIQIAPRDILGNFKVPSDFAKKLLNDRHAELVYKNVEMKKTNNIQEDKIGLVENYEKTKENIKTLIGQRKHLKMTEKRSQLDLLSSSSINIKEYLQISEFLEIDDLLDILPEQKIKFVKEKGFKYAYQLLTLSVLELIACGLSIIEISKIQEKIKENDRIKAIDTTQMESRTDVDMRTLPLPVLTLNANNDLRTNKTDIDSRQLQTIIENNAVITETSDIDEEPNLIIDEESSNYSENELELLKRDLQDKIKETSLNDNIDIESSNDVLEHKIVNCYQKNFEMFVEETSIMKPKEPLYDAENDLNIVKANYMEVLDEIHGSSSANKDLNSYNINYAYTIASPEQSPIINLLDEDINTDDIPLPFTIGLQNYKPAIEYDGSLATHPPIQWMLNEILVPAIKPIQPETREKLEQIDDPRVRKRIIPTDRYSFDGNSQNMNELFMPNKNLIDPRKNHTKIPNYNDNNNSIGYQPSAIQILQHYLHKSPWYNEQNSKTKMEINELIADLAKQLKKYKQQNIPSKQFLLCELKYFHKIQNILSNLKIFIDPNGTILQENVPQLNYFNNAGIIQNNNYNSNFDQFWSGFQPPQPQLPVISNLVPVGSFHAPAPLQFRKPGLLGMYPGDEFNKSGINNLNINNNANDLFYGNQEFQTEFDQTVPLYNDQYNRESMNQNRNFNGNRGRANNNNRNAGNYNNRGNYNNNKNNNNNNNINNNNYNNNNNNNNYRNRNNNNRFNNNGNNNNNYKRNNNGRKNFGNNESNGNKFSGNQNESKTIGDDNNWDDDSTDVANNNINQIKNEKTNDNFVATKFNRHTLKKDSDEDWDDDDDDNSNVKKNISSTLSKTNSPNKEQVSVSKIENRKTCSDEDWDSDSNDNVAKPLSVQSSKNNSIENKFDTPPSAIFSNINIIKSKKKCDSDEENWDSEEEITPPKTLKLNIPKNTETDNKSNSYEGANSNAQFSKNDSYKGNLHDDNRNINQFGIRSVAIDCDSKIKIKKKCDSDEENWDSEEEITPPKTLKLNVPKNIESDYKNNSYEEANSSAEFSNNRNINQFEIRSTAMDCDGKTSTPMDLNSTTKSPLEMDIGNKINSPLNMHIDKRSNKSEGDKYFTDVVGNRISHLTSQKNQNVSIINNVEIIKTVSHNHSDEENWD